MTRFHYFNYLYPDVAKQRSLGYQEMSSTIWNAFTRVTGINKFFKFTPSEFDTADQAEAKGQGMVNDYDHTQNPL